MHSNNSWVPSRMRSHVGCWKVTNPSESLESLSRIDKGLMQVTGIGGIGDMALMGQVGSWDP